LTTAFLGERSGCLAASWSILIFSLILCALVSSLIKPSSKDARSAAVSFSGSSPSLISFKVLSIVARTWSASTLALVVFIELVFSISFLFAQGFKQFSIPDNFVQNFVNTGLVAPGSQFFHVLIVQNRFHQLKLLKKYPLPVFKVFDSHSWLAKLSIYTARYIDSKKQKQVFLLQATCHHVTQNPTICVNMSPSFPFSPTI